MPEENRDLILGQVLGELSAIKAQSEAGAAAANAADARHAELIGEMTKGFGEVTTAIGRVDQKLDSHIGEDDRRFTEHRGDIDRLEGQSPATPGVSGTNRAVKVGGAATGGGLLLVLLNWLRETFLPGGPPAP